jgi:hypothetical protein
MSNKIKIVFLGNCASAPTSLRNLTSVLINYNGQGYLFDCPENTQQQIMKSKLSAMKINDIFVMFIIVCITKRINAVIPETRCMLQSLNEIYSSIYFKYYFSIRLVLFRSSKTS